MRDEGELLLQAVDGGERRLEGAQIGGGRPAGNDAQISRTDGRERAVGIDAGGVDEHVVVGGFGEPLHHEVDLRGVDLRHLGTVGGAVVKPVGDRGLPVHFQDADGVSGFLRRDRERDAQGALAAASLLRDERDRFHAGHPTVFGFLQAVRSCDAGMPRSRISPIMVNRPLKDGRPRTAQSFHLRLVSSFNAT